MSARSRIVVATLAAVLIASAAGAALFVWSGRYDVGADDPHTRPVGVLLQALRERSIETRAARLQLPADLQAPARLLQGAGNYDAMCVQCHLAPGMGSTELSKGLYPAPPNLAEHAPHAAEAFWVIKHGIKATGMPAWGKSVDDEAIWDLAAFLQQLPKLDAAAYQDMVARSGGHSHGGMQVGRADGQHEHAHAQPAAKAHAPAMGHDAKAKTEQAAAPAEPAAATTATHGTTHTHADGKAHHHDAPRP